MCRAEFWKEFWGDQAMYYTREAVEAGGLIYYGADEAISHRRVAYCRGQDPEGRKARDLLVEQPTKFELTIGVAARQKNPTAFAMPSDDRVSRVSVPPPSRGCASG